MNAARKRPSGFTLAELLIATVLLSIVMSALYTMTYGTLGAWRSLNEGADPYGELRRSLTVFRHEIENTIAGGAAFFEGDAGEISFLTVSEPLNLAEADGAHLMQVRYYTQYKGGSLSLEREERIATGAMPNEENAQGRLAASSRLKLDRPERFQMASNLESFTIRYIWYPAESAGLEGGAPVFVEPIYQNRHRAEWGLPQGVEIVISVPQEDPDLAPISIRTEFPIRPATHRLGKQALMILGAQQ